MRYIPCDLILSSLCCYHSSFSFFHNQRFGSKAGVNLFLHSCFTNTFVPIDKSIFLIISLQPYTLVLLTVSFLYSFSPV
jgi:hypothetical protein